ncbi:MAG: nucleotidyltransferase family protein [Chthoniobacterales bacterium]
MKTEWAEVSWQRMEQGIEKVRIRLLRAAEALRAAGLTYAVIGGNAVAAWVSRVDESAVRNTRDVDILVRRADFEKIRSALEKAGFIHRQVSALGRPGGMDVFLDGPGAKVRDAIHILWAGEKITEKDPEPTPDPAGSEESGGFALISLQSLVRMKLTASRDKDRMHLRDLLDVGLIDESWMANLPAPLAERLRLILDNPLG